MESYNVHFNGGRPFRVTLDRNLNAASVFAWEAYDSVNDKDFYAAEPCTAFSYQKVWVGIGDGSPEQLGNTLLFQLADERDMHVCVGYSVMWFRLPAQVNRYESPIGRNDVPYPVAECDDGFAYLLTEKQYVPVQELECNFQNTAPMTIAREIRSD